MNIFFICVEMKVFIYKIIKNMYLKMFYLRILINNYKIKYCFFINVFWILIVMDFVVEIIRKIKNSLI